MWCKELFFDIKQVVYARVTCSEVSEIERVSKANELRFLIQTNECVNTVQSTFHIVVIQLAVLDHFQ